MIIEYTAKGLWTPENFVLFAVIVTSTLLGRLSLGFWSVALRTCAHSVRRAIARSDTDVRRERVACGWCSSSSHSNSSSSTPTSSSWTLLCHAGTGLVKGKSSCHSKERCFRQMCAYNFVVTAWVKNHVWM